MEAAKASAGSLARLINRIREGAALSPRNRRLLDQLEVQAWGIRSGIGCLMEERGWIPEPAPIATGPGDGSPGVTDTTAPTVSRVKCPGCRGAGCLWDGVDGRWDECERCEGQGYYYAGSEQGGGARGGDDGGGAGARVPGVPGPADPDPGGGAEGDVPPAVGVGRLGDGGPAGVLPDVRAAGPGCRRCRGVRFARGDECPFCGRIGR